MWHWEHSKNSERILLSIIKVSTKLGYSIWSPWGLTEIIMTLVYFTCTPETNTFVSEIHITFFSLNLRFKKKNSLGGSKSALHLSKWNSCLEIALKAFCAAGNHFLPCRDHFFIYFFYLFKTCDYRIQTHLLSGVIIWQVGVKQQLCGITWHISSLQIQIGYADNLRVSTSL